MNIQGFYLMPHPPIIVPEVGRGEQEKINATSMSMHTIGRDIQTKAPNTIIVVTPHGTMFQDAIALAYEDKLSGNLKNFGTPQVSMEHNIDKPLTNKIYELALADDIPVVLVTDDLLSSYKAELSIDHGALVPLSFIDKYYDNYKLVHITYAPLSDMELYRFGMVIEKALEEFERNVVFIASGDLSHRLKKEGTYDYSPYGERFDKEFLYNLENGNVMNLFNMDKETICNAGECGRRSVFIMLGALEGKKFEGELLSYEGTFGVGYGVMRFKILSENTSMLQELENLKKQTQGKKLQQTNPYVKLARESITTYLTTGKRIKSLPDYASKEMKENKRGVFVSLKKFGELRGCIGTFLPTTDSITQEIIRNSIEAAVSDPRFDEVQVEELLDIDISVDILTEPEPASKEGLNPKEYGIIVSSNKRRGLLLPDLEGVDTIEEQLTIALRKASIEQNESYSIERFKVIRHTED
jgi:MEMO1 family protein